MSIAKLSAFQDALQRAASSAPIKIKLDSSQSKNPETAKDTVTARLTEIRGQLPEGEVTIVEISSDEAPAATFPVHHPVFDDLYHPLAAFERALRLLAPLKRRA